MEILGVIIVKRVLHQQFPVCRIGVAVCSNCYHLVSGIPGHFGEVGTGSSKKNFK